MYNVHEEKNWLNAVPDSAESLKKNIVWYLELLFYNLL